jgi:rhomboid protease GluP
VSSAGPEQLPPDSVPEETQETPPSRPRPRQVRLHLPERPPLVTYLFLALTILVYLSQVLTGEGYVDLLHLTCPYFATPDLPSCFGLKVNELILEGQLWRLITPILLHGSLLHIGFNMYALYILGPDLEQHYGHAGFLALYLTSGFAGFVLSFLLTDAPSLGASTTIFGLLAAQGVFVYRNRLIFGRRAQLVLRSIINIALINFLIGLAPGIDNWGHLGGFLGGALFAWIAAPEYRVEGEAPDMRLVDKNLPGRAWYATLAVMLIFGAAAAGAILGFSG